MPVSRRPKADSAAPLRCLIFDSYYDSYRGVIPHIRVFSGSLTKGDKITVKSTGKTFEVDEVGYFTPDLVPTEKLSAGEVGYLGAIIREVGDIHVGDTIISPEHPETPAIPGFRRAQPMVFCGIYPISTNDYPKLTVALEKFQLNDSSIVYEKETSAALGHGYRLGFLGMLHMDITLERLKREYGQDLIATMPSVIYKVVTRQGEKTEELMIDNPSRFPDPQFIDHIEEPIIEARIIVPNDHIGSVMELSEQTRGTLKNMEHPDKRRAMLTYEFPLAEIITGYYDKLKSVSRGYASMDYEFIGYKPGPLVKVDILVKENQVDALSFISDRDSAVGKARVLIHKLRKLIPRQLFLDSAAGGYRRQDHCQGRYRPGQKRCAGQMLRRRYYPQEEAPGKAERRQKADEDGGFGRGAPGSLPPAAQDGRVGILKRVTITSSLSP